MAKGNKAPKSRKAPKPQKAPKPLRAPDGKPVEREMLSQELGAPSLAGIRNIWMPTLGDLTPERLISILQEAVHGSARAYLTLAEEMEEKNLHYKSVLGTRKLAVAGIKPTVVAGGKEKEDLDLAQEIQEIIDRPEFKSVVMDLLDALGKGYSVVEIIWQRGRRWIPTFKHRDARWFRYDYATGEELRLLDEIDPAFGIPMLPYKWIIHTPHLKTGLPIRGGLARLAATAHMCKSFSLADWMAFADVFGIPIKIGRFGPGATDADKRALKACLVGLGTMASGIVPKSMDVELLQPAGGSGGAGLFKELADFWDSQTSKGVLGQTMTVDDGSSLSQAAVHNEVRHDIRDEDGMQLGGTLSAFLVRPYIDLNYGPRERYPRVEFKAPEKKDPVKMAQAFGPFIDRGFRVNQSYVASLLGTPVVGNGEDVLTPAKSKSSGTVPGEKAQGAEE